MPIVLVEYRQIFNALVYLLETSKLIPNKG